jgi:hypothetical protein
VASRLPALASRRLAASALCLCVLWLWACDEEGHETSSRDVSLEEVPEAARRTLLEQAGENRIRELEEKIVDGQTLYEIELLVDGQETEVVVAPDGKLVRIKREGGGGITPAAALTHAADDSGWRRDFAVDPKQLGIAGHNPFFPLTPGLAIHLSGGGETVVFSVLNETEIVDGVETRVVEERETEDGELLEISRNYFAIDRATNDVYYFGEDVDIYEGGKVVSHDGAWRAGEGNVKFGLIMPGKPIRGDRFYLEMAPGAVERVEIAALDATLETPLRKFDQLVYCREHDVLDGEVSEKWYAAGIGMIGDDEMRVVKIEQPSN